MLYAYLLALRRIPFAGYGERSTNFYSMFFLYVYSPVLSVYLCYLVPPTLFIFEKHSIQEFLFLERQSLKKYGFFIVSEINMSLKGHHS